MHFFSLKRCKETVLYKRFSIMVFMTSWRATGLGMLTEWKNTYRSPVWSNACRGDSSSATRAWLAAVLPPALRLEKQQKLCHTCVAPAGKSAAVT